MKMKMYAPIFLAILGITAFSRNDQNVFALTDDEKTKLEAEGYKMSFIDKFNAALAVDFAEGTATTENAEAPQLPDMQTLRETALALANAQEQLEKLNGDVNALEKDKLAAQAKINDLQGQVTTLSNKPEHDEGAGTQHAHGMETQFNLMDEKQLGGYEGVMWSLDRPYNQRARAALLLKQGKQLIVPVQQAVDFSALEADLGAYYRTRRPGQLLSFINKLQDVSNIFPLESNVQDQQVITNLFLGEFSQADNSDSTFENVVKGTYEIQPEIITMYDVMSSPKYTKLKELEKQWIADINKDGSSSFKMSFVEFLLSRTTEQLFNEQQRRRIVGIRKNPVVNVPGLAMEASTGVYRYIHEKINNLQIKTFPLGDVTSSNIGDKVFEGTKLIPREVLDRNDVALYMPADMVVEYHKWHETHSGLNQDYKANIMYVKEFPNVEIIPVPNAGNHRRLIWTPKGNIKTFEYVPGEMTNYRILLQMWSINVSSQWKEGIGAVMVGKKWTRAQDMDYAHQMIFTSDTDLSSTEFLPMPQDTTTPSALFHSSLVSVANTALKTITDITNVAVGAQVTLKNGNDTYGIALAKSGNFSLIASAWNPGVGDTITLVKRADGKFIELSRSDAATTILALDADDTTPSVAGGTEFQTNANTQATAITTFDDAVTGVTYTIYGAGTTNASTMANSGNFTLTAAMTLSATHSITLIALGDGKFAEISRT